MESGYLLTLWSSRLKARRHRPKSMSKTNASERVIYEPVTRDKNCGAGSEFPSNINPQPSISLEL
jgi:hypothetical protein